MRFDNYLKESPMKVKAGSIKKEGGGFVSLEYNIAGKSVSPVKVSEEMLGKFGVEEIRKHIERILLVRVNKIIKII